MSCRYVNTSLAAIVIILALPRAGQAQLVLSDTAPASVRAPGSGSPMYEYVDHTNTPIYTVDQIHISRSPIGRDRSANRGTPALADDYGPVYSNIGNGSGFATFPPGVIMGGDDYDSSKNGADLGNMDGFRFVGGVVTANDVIYFDHFDQNATGGPGNLIGSWGVQLPNAGNHVWTITGLGLVDPIPDKGWVFASGLGVEGNGDGQWFLDDGTPSIGSEDATQGGASSGSLKHNFELINIVDPGNDSCANAQDTGAMPSATHGFNFLASTDGAGCLSFLQLGNVWFTVVGDGNTITADLCNDDLEGLAVFDAAMTVHCNGCDTPACVGFNDDGCGLFGESPSVTWCSTVGGVYTIGVGSKSGDFGDFNLEISSDGQACSTADPCIACGDGVVQGGEECDDGNNDSFDGCSPECMIECGDGFRSPIEECDDGNSVDGDGCSSACEYEENVPTVSQWGMLVLVSFLLIGLTIKFRRRPVTA